MDNDRHRRPRRRVVGWGVAMLLMAGAGAVDGAPATQRAFVDPAPPSVAALDPMPAPPPRDNPDAGFHSPPRPLADRAVTHDWKSFLGPTHNLVSTEAPLLDKFPPDGPKVVWEMRKGEGYAAPAIAGERLILFHRIGANEVVDCLHPADGRRYWRYAYPSAYRDRYGYCDGPRASPVIGGDKDQYVFTCGAEGKLHCLDLATGRVIWARDLLREFKIRQNFFGVGSTPLVEGGQLIVNVGAPGGPCVASFDLASGKMRWGAGDQWGPSYASPIPAVVHGRRRVFVFAGGETGFRQPPTGGLLCIDPDTGRVDFTFPWRGDRRESVNASSPLVIGDQVFISECYGAGGVLLDILPDMTCKPAWTNAAFGAHFMTPAARDGFLYGVDGHGPNDAVLACVDRKTGKDVWRTQPEWKEQARPDAEPRITGTYRAHLLQLDHRCLCLGEFGHLLWLDLQPQGYKELQRTTLFSAPETWTPPVLSRGLLYICQNAPDPRSAKPPRLLCYDLRAEAGEGKTAR